MEIRKSTLALLLAGSLFVGGASTYGVMQWRTGSPLTGGDLLRSSTGQQMANFSKLEEVYKTLRYNYYQNVDDQKLVDGAISGMIGALDDPYSTYMDKDTADQFHMSLSSSFEGIGATIESINGRITIASPIKGSPAEKAGLRAGDQIRKVNGQSLDGLEVNQAVLFIRGRKGTVAELEITRPGSSEVTHVSVVRDEIPLETVYAEYLGNGIGKIQITSFSENTAKRFEEELKKLEEQGLKGLLIDVRDNPGGYLEAVKGISNLLIPNKGVILQVEYKNGQKEVVNSTLETAKYPVVCLINGGSASASEILAGALKESGGYPLVGEKTFGKGTVQTQQEFKDGSNLKYTTAKWLTPKGNWIHKRGVEPDYPVALPAYFKLTALNPDTPLKRDMNGTAVKTLQQMLIGVGLVPGREDGYFSAQTEEAVKTFQRMNGLSPTGVVEGQTTFKLMEAINEKKKINDTQLEKATSVLRSLIK
ncbi:S41 family peptidase [Effusibacillus lacus]|uniref:Peptidase S41 n=1 Tax=Effusibacillus lacus TaxID=1348429 RepID=A0A292YQZ6_9BACL|nr:S41 family peptidase [Effusibacillus lacus]TCS74179.1 carboxyl-terminal processing protease [Effusibacillus lacus]GAX90824.1 peptidase S41 [Effusibacillus lacus]